MTSKNTIILNKKKWIKRLRTLDLTQVQPKPGIQYDKSNQVDGPKSILKKFINQGCSLANLYTGATTINGWTVNTVSKFKCQQLLEQISKNESSFELEEPECRQKRHFETCKCQWKQHRIKEVIPPCHIIK